ncbi:nucleotide sugar dehydrogenase [Hwanghaeella grinnelliae]|uniref:Nucleotide sugar dehydrogenase n=1 Tax=Hwanghaeella grinnelliae TaxID=2500179 RepID=A0A3S2W4Q7_9PROT|nr:nucleotide sugar dehydrogenase [Hwanghaeella grinnelliae]RVU36449.1 nucleotide sugar dehydrogenase [Hwanghaeella grinnelliae]
MDRWTNPTIAVIGLGYVGLPLAVALSRDFDVLGFDIDTARIQELNGGHDRTNELTPDALTSSSAQLTGDLGALQGRDIFIVTVPTPVSEKNEPDLTAVKKAAETVGKAIGKGGIAVFESTVYPGVTEDICGPAIEAASGLKAGTDFFLGYSPERINPGDKVHTVDKITKVVAGQTPEVAAVLARVYGAMNGDRIHIAPDIKTAEASKVIENAQRDINIAFVNEIALIFERMGLSVYDVLDAARTKWNFLDFKPGLVGGHCIGVDPYYLSHAAQQMGYDPDVILSGRRINDAMGSVLAERIHKSLGIEGAKILVLGITFKENVPDIRNSKVIDVIRGLEAFGHSVSVYDPLADIAETKHEYGVDLIGEPSGPYHAVLGAVPHAAFNDMPIAELLEPDGLVADIKGIWRGVDLGAGLRRWSL